MIRFGLLRHILKQTDLLTEKGVCAFTPSNGNSAGKKRILIVDSDISFFKVIQLPPGAKVNREFIQLNYMHLSPFEGADFCYFRDKQQLLLWFFPAQEYNYSFIVPEGYLVWKGIAQSHLNAICASAAANKVKLFVLREGVLNAQLVKALFRDRGKSLEEAIQWAKNDSNLKDLETVVLEESFLRQGIEGIRIRDLVPFFRVELDREALVFDTLNAIRWPLLILLSVYVITSYGMYWNVGREINNTREEISVLRGANQALKKRIDSHANLRQFWESFQSSEMVYPYPLDMLEEVTQIVEEQNGSIALVKFSENRMTMNMLSDSLSATMERLLKIGCFEKVSLNGQINKDEKTGKDKAVVEAVLKKRTRDRLANP